MTALLFTALIVCLATFDLHAGGLKTMERYEWQLSEMNPKLLEVALDPNTTRDCGEERCTFGLHYFTSEGFDLSVANRKTILFIPGGPGQIVDRKEPPLSFLEKEYNVVYFDVRGTGHSLVERSTRYDKYLRAEYVINDIEKIREALKIKTWHAIYAHSWGTIVAHQYASMSESLGNAERVANPGRGARNLVEKLILSAPVARRRKVTENDRNAMILSNIKEIYKQYSTPHSSCANKLREIEAKILADENDLAGALKKSLASPRESGRDSPEGTDDFCFLTPEFIDDKILAKLRKTLIGLDEYGSLSFGGNYYENLQNDYSFRQFFPYQKEFYTALRILQFLGGPEQPPVSPNYQSRQDKTSLVLYLGYYLTLPEEAWKDRNHVLHPSKPGTPGCQADAPLFRGLSKKLQEKFCLRINFTEVQILGGGRRSTESARAHTVFGVYDGLNRWIFETLEKKHRLDKYGCFTGREIQDLAEGRLETNEKVNAAARSLAMNLSETICPWAPLDHAHPVTTLILKGKADPIIAGGQAEEFFEEGLIGERILIEFPGVGHNMQLPGITVDDKRIDGDEALAKLISQFLSASGENGDFGMEIIQRQGDADLYKMLAKFQVEMQVARADKTPDVVRSNSVLLGGSAAP